MMGICAPLSSPSPLQEKEGGPRPRLVPGVQKGLGDGGGGGVGELIPGVSGTTMKGVQCNDTVSSDEPPALRSHPITCFQGPFSLCKSPTGRREKRTSVTQPQPQMEGCTVPALTTSPCGPDGRAGFPCSLLRCPSSPSSPHPQVLIAVCGTVGLPCLLTCC